MAFESVKVRHCEQGVCAIGEYGNIGKMVGVEEMGGKSSSLGCPLEGLNSADLKGRLMIRKGRIYCQMRGCQWSQKREKSLGNTPSEMVIFPT